MKSNEKRFLSLTEEIINECTQNELAYFLGKLGAEEITDDLTGKANSFDTLHAALRGTSPNEKQKVLNALYSCAMEVSDDAFHDTFCTMTPYEFASFENLFQRKRAEKIEKRLMNVLRTFHKKSPQKEIKPHASDGASILLNACDYMTEEKIKRGRMTREEADREEAGAAQVAESLLNMANLMVDRGASRKEAMEACVDFALDSAGMPEEDKEVLKDLLLGGIGES